MNAIRMVLDGADWFARVPLVQRVVTLAIIIGCSFSSAGASITMTVAPVSNSTIDTRNGVFTDWAVPSSNNLIGERQSGSNELTSSILSGTVGGSGPGGSFVYNHGTPVSSGSSSGGLIIDGATGPAGTYASYEIDAAVAAGESGELTVYETGLGSGTLICSGVVNGSGVLFGGTLPTNDSADSIKLDFTNASAGTVGIVVSESFNGPSSNIVADFWGATLSAQVPEPTSLMIIGATSFALLTRRRFI